MKVTDKRKVSTVEFGLLKEGDTFVDIYYDNCLYMKIIPVIDCNGNTLDAIDFDGVLAEFEYDYHVSKVNAEVVIE